MMQLNVTPDFKKRSLKFGPEFPAAAKLESVELVIPNPDGKIKTAGLSFIIYSARCGSRKLAVCDAFTGTGTITGTLNLCTDRMVDEFYHLPLGTRRSFHAVLWSEADQWMIGAGRISIANNPGSDSLNPAPLPADRYPTFEEVKEMIRNSGGLDEPVVRRVNGITPDNAGNVSITIPGDVSELKDKDGLTLTVQQKNTLATLSTTYAAKNHSHSEYALKSELPDVSGFITADKLNLYQLKADAFSGKYADLAGKPSAFPPASHTHAVADVNGLADELSRKLTVPAGGNAGQFLMKTVSGCGWSSIDLASYITITQARNEFAAKTHEHSQYALASALQDYAAKVHTHIIGDVTGLQDALDGKAASGHNHDSAYAPKEATAAALNTKLTIPAGGTIGQVIGKTADGYGWITVSGGSGGVSSWNDLTDKPSTFPPSEHTHAITDVGGLQTVAEQAHAHTNKAVLDELGASGDTLTFKGAAVGNGSGSGGASALAELSDTENIADAAGGQVLTYNSSTGKWGPADAAAAEERNDISFTTADLTEENKLVISNCTVGGFAILDENQKQVFPDPQQVAGNVEIDFTGWTITGTWTVKFISGGSGSTEAVGSVTWADLLGKPSTFPPETHTHDQSAINGLTEALNGKLTTPTGGTAGQVLTKNANGSEWADIPAPTGVVLSVNGNTPNIAGAVTIPDATSSAAGLMSAADKTKLNGLAASTAVSVNGISPDGSGNIVLNAKSVASNESVNNVTEPGTYYVDSGAGGLPLNGYAGGAYMMDVIHYESAEYTVQRLTGTYNCNIQYMRTQRGGSASWSPWASPFDLIYGGGSNAIEDRMSGWFWTRLLQDAPGGVSSSDDVLFAQLNTYNNTTVTAQLVFNSATGGIYMRKYRGGNWVPMGVNGMYTMGGSVDMAANAAESENITKTLQIISISSVVATIDFAGSTVNWNELTSAPVVYVSHNTFAHNVGSSTGTLTLRFRVINPPAKAYKINWMLTGTFKE